MQSEHFLLSGILGRVEGKIGRGQRACTPPPPSTHTQVSHTKQIAHPKLSVRTTVNKEIVSFGGECCFNTKEI